MATIRDVAKQAGVAPITVSRVINGSDYVSEKTREKVEAVVQELGYVPNMLGPSLRFKQTMTLALLVTDITNPFWTTVLRGVEDVAQANGYSTIICNTDESWEKQLQYLNMLLRRRIDGILLVPADNSPEHVRLIQKQTIPVVALDRKIPGVDLDLIRSDTEEGAYQLTRHLVSLGHRQIMMLAGPQSVSTSLDRVRGFCKALEETEVEDCESRVFWGHYTQDSGYQLAEKVLASDPRPTALFAANNFVALGAMRAIQQHGLKIPEDIALVAVDGLPAVIPEDAFLTAAIQPARELGQRAAQRLIDRIKGDVTGPAEEIVLPIELKIHKSSEKPSA